MEKFRWAYIGSGGIAHSTAREITKGNHEIVSVYSRNKQKAEAFAEKYGAEAFDSFEQATESCIEIDSVTEPNPKTQHIYEKLFRKYKDIHDALEKIYRTDYGV